MTIHVYAVFGRGQFPSDMLRYDQAVVLAGPLVRSDVPGVSLPENCGPVWLLASRTKPTVGRWNSFLWGVSMVIKTRQEVLDEQKRQQEVVGNPEEM